MVSNGLTKRRKDASVDDQALEQLLDEAKKRVNGSDQRSDDEKKDQIEIEKMPADAREDSHVW